ncbi:MAG: M23 family metallopeptidase [Anaerovoracaceae bacterium]
MLKLEVKKKIILVLMPIFLTLGLFTIPVLLAGAVIAAPVVLVGDLFNKIGDFVFGDETPNEAIDLIYQFLDSKEGKEIVTKYQAYLKDVDVKIPLAYLLIPNILSGNEDPNKDVIEKQIEFAQDGKEVKDLNKYIDDLRSISPFNENFKKISTTTIAGYIEEFLDYGVYDPMDPEHVGSINKDDYLYPFTKKAVVTSEYGWRYLPGLDGLPSYNLHDAIDLAFGGNEACGMPIYAVMDGTLRQSDVNGNMSGANYGIISQGTIEQWYLHLRDPFPYPVGTKIKKGDFVGYVGSTGLSTACHLHLGFYTNGQAKNPRLYMDFDNPKLPIKN